MNVPDIISDKDSFWELNPSYRFIFSDIYDNDKSKNKIKSSRIMWGMYYKLHPKSDFYYLNDKDNIISEKWIKDKTFKWEDYKDVEEIFIDSILTQAEKSLNNWNQYMKERDIYLKNTRYYFDEYAVDDNGDNLISKTGRLITIKGTAEQLDKAWLSSKAMWADYLKIKKELVDEAIKKGKGDKPLSMSDTNEI